MKEELGKSELGELGAIGFDEAVGPDGYVSATTIGTTIGVIGGLPGMMVGAMVGAAIDVFLNARRKKQQRKDMQREFFEKLLKRYNTQIFISALERMGPAMVYIQSLGLKPGSPEYDAALTKKLKTEIGYKGNCEIDLLGVSAPGQPRGKIASIDRRGNMQAYSPHIDTALGPKWIEACRAFHRSALQAWAEEQKGNILFLRDIEKDKAVARRKTTTRLLTNAGALMLFIGYIVRQKKKLKFIRVHKQTTNR